MGVTKSSGGPLEAYLEIKGQDEKAFEKDVKTGDANAVIIFAAEMLSKNLQDLALGVENSGD